MAGPGPKPMEKSKQQEQAKKQEQAQTLQQRKALELKNKAEPSGKLKDRSDNTAEGKGKTSELKKPDAKKQDSSKIDRKELERQQRRGSTEPSDMASGPHRPNNLDKSIPQGKYTIENLTPPKKSPERAPRESKAPPDPAYDLPKGDATKLKPNAGVDKRHNWVFEPEEVRRSDKKLSPQEVAERKSVYRPHGGVGHYFNGALPAEGHLDKWAKEDLSPEKKEALKHGNVIVTVTSFASRPGSEKSNKDITDQRSKDVAQQISDRYGIPMKNIMRVSVGEQAAKDVGHDPDKDSRFDRITLIDVIPLDTTKSKDQKIDIKEGDPGRIANRLIDAFPPPKENEWKKHASDAISAVTPNPGSLLIGLLLGGPEKALGPAGPAAKLTLLSFKDWIEASAQAKENFQASANFIPAFMGEITRLTTGKAEYGAHNPRSADAIVGRRLADEHYLQLSKTDRTKLTHIMKDDRPKKEFLNQVEHGLRERFIFK